MIQVSDLERDDLILSMVFAFVWSVVAVLLTVMWTLFHSAWLAVPFFASLIYVGWHAVWMHHLVKMSGY